MIINIRNNAQIAPSFKASGAFNPRYTDSLKNITSANISSNGPDLTRCLQHITNTLLENIIKLAADKEIKPGIVPNTFYKKGQTRGHNLNIIISDAEIRIEHGDRDRKINGITELKREMKHEDDPRFDAAISALKNLQNK